MGLTSYVNRISRLTNKLWMTILALLISILLFVSKLEDLVVGLWLIFIFFSLIFSLNGILLKSSFNKEINKFLKLGKPVKGISGFSELNDALNQSLIESLIISFASLLSFSLYYLTILTSIIDVGNIGKTLAVSMVFVTVSVMFLVEYPRDPSFTPGGLIGYYEPDVFPLKLDNLLTDVFLTYVDPATFLKVDEWSNGILNYLKPSFENDEIDAIRLERAREKVLLLAYLNYSNKIAFTEDVIQNELKELFGDENYSKFITGKGTGLTWTEVKDIIERIEERAPEPFRLVDRLMISLTDNYKSFTSNDLYFTVSVKSNQGRVTESSGIIVFFINKTTREDRQVTVRLETDDRTIHPASQQVTMTLDPMTDPFPKEQPPLIAQGDDILSLLSILLQVGDAIWFRLQPTGFGYRVVSIQAEEKNGKVFGKSFELRFTKAISWYVKAYAPKLSALGSIALPIIGSVIDKIS